jgi:glucose-6-phosphate 1-epimerase
VLYAATDGGGAATARLRLVSDGSDTPFPHPFTLHLEVVAAAGTMTMALKAVNDGQEPFAFTAALHTYLRVSSTAAVTVHGLDGLTAEPNDGSAGFLVEGPLRVVGPIDVAVDLAGGEDGGEVGGEVGGDLGGGAAGAAAREVVLDDPVLGAVALTAGSFGSRVVWNPGPGAAPGDVHAGGEAEFVCLEPAQLEPVLLAPGGRWTGWQRLTATVPPG